MMLSPSSATAKLLLPAVLLAVITLDSSFDIADANIVNSTRGDDDAVTVVVTAQQLKDAKEAARKTQQAIVMSNIALNENNTVRTGDTPGSIIAGTRRITNPAAAIESEEAEFELLVANQISKMTGLTNNQRRFGLRGIRLEDDTSFGICHWMPTCDPDQKYRTADGTCNNLQNPRWGQSHTAFVRYLDPDYADGFQEPRKAASGNELPSARIVSTASTAAVDNPHPVNSHMLMQFAQFVDHDLSHTPVTTYGSTSITCCPTIRHSSCLPITIPENDSFFGPLGVRCMEFVRSAPVRGRDCSFTPREQMNSLTSYIDASHIYGSTSEEASKLRLGNDGKLLYATGPDGQILLPPNKVTEQCRDEPKDCFLAGDSRVNEQPNLAVMHTIWMREHNRIVTQLSLLNPHWDDETLYQEGRRIVGAMFQHMIYNDYLPRVLGESFVRRQNLTPARRRYINVYDSSVDASIANEFATAAYRYGHTLIQHDLQGFSKNNQLVRSLPISSVAFAPSFLYERNSLDEMLRGLFTQKCQSFDRNFVTELTNKLFARNSSFGLDLVALNIQRGRDHGIPSYLRLREACGFGQVRSFRELRRVIPTVDVTVLESIYESVDDIDLFIGGILERNNQGGLLGETFQCLIGEAFIRLKVGDRFFYENGENENTRFTLDQLDQIRKASLSRVICDNTDDISEISVDVFQANAPRVSCNDTRRIPAINLDLWKESTI